MPIRPPHPPIALVAALLGGLAALPPTAPGQSPWTREAGHGFAQLSTYAVQYDKLYTSGSGDFRTSREITDVTVEAYGEFGLTDDLTLIGRVPYKLLDAGDAVANPSLPSTIRDASLTRFGNLAVALRQRWLDDDFTLSGQLEVELPTGDFDQSSGLRTGYDAFTFAPLVSIGRGFGRAYAFGYGGFGFRTGDYSNTWRLGGEAGYRVLEPLLVAGFVDVVQSFEDGDVRLPTTNLETGLYVNDQEWVAFGVKGLLQLGEGIGLQATVQGAFDANNVPKAPLFGLGFTFEW